MLIEKYLSDLGVRVHVVSCPCTKRALRTSGCAAGRLTRNRILDTDFNTAHLQDRLRSDALPRRWGELPALAKASGTPNVPVVSARRQDVGTTPHQGGAAVTMEDRWRTQAINKVLAGLRRGCGGPLGECGLA